LGANHCLLASMRSAPAGAGWRMIHPPLQLGAHHCLLGSMRSAPAGAGWRMIHYPLQLGANHCLLASMRSAPAGAGWRMIHPPLQLGANYCLLASTGSAQADAGGGCSIPPCSWVRTTVCSRQQVRHKRTQVEDAPSPLAVGCAPSFARVQLPHEYYLSIWNKSCLSKKPNLSISLPGRSSLHGAFIYATHK
jgi:hypothetical protein